MKDKAEQDSVRLREEMKQDQHMLDAAKYVIAMAKDMEKERTLPILNNTGVAAKNDSEKADLSLVPRVALEAAARAFQVGEKKYGRYNYYKGHTASQLIAALMRHATAWMEGEENDPQDGQAHLGSVIACAAMLLQQQKLGTLKDNRYKETK